MKVGMAWHGMVCRARRKEAVGAISPSRPATCEVTGIPSPPVAVATACGNAAHASSAARHSNRARPQP